MNTAEQGRLSASAYSAPSPQVHFWTAAYVMLLCILFGANAVAIKVAFEGFGVFTAAVIRFSIASGVIALWALFSGRSFKLKQGQWRYLLVYSLLFTAQLSLFFTGLNRTYASRGTLLVNLLPFFILILAHFFIPGDRITWRSLIGLILGFSGVVFVFAGKEALSRDMRWGDGLVFLATLLWAANTVFIKRVINAFKPFHIVLYSMLFSLPFFMLEAYWFDDVFLSAPSLRDVIALGYQTFVTASFGFIAWNGLLKTYGAVTLHAFVFIMPLAGVVLSGWLLREPLYPNIWLALALVVAGILVVHLKRPERISVFPLRRPM